MATQQTAGLRNRRRALGLTVREISVYLNVTPPTIYSWECGAALIPQPHLERLGRIFSVAIEQLREEDEATHKAFRQQALARVTAVTAKTG